MLSNMSRFVDRPRFVEITPIVGRLRSNGNGNDNGVANGFLQNGKPDSNETKKKNNKLYRRLYIRNMNNYFFSEEDGSSSKHHLVI